MKKAIFIASAAVTATLCGAPSIASGHMCDFYLGGDPPKRMSCTVRWNKGGETIFIDNDSTPELPRYLSKNSGGKFINSGPNGSCLSHPTQKWQICPSKDLLRIMSR